MIHPLRGVDFAYRLKFWIGGAMMAKHWRTRSLGILALLVVLAVLAGCSPFARPTDPDEPAVPDTPRRVVIGQGTDVKSFDPPADWTSLAEWITQNAYDYLFYRSADQGEWIPELAYDWERRDELTYRFWIHEGVRFHDGSELTAEDIKYTYRRIIEGPTEMFIVSDQYQWIDRIEIIDDYTFDVISKEPDSLFIFKLSQGNTGAGIVNKEHTEAVGHDGLHREPMGTGPWLLKEWVRDEHVLFERNEDYWQTDRFPTYDELEYRIIPEASTRVAELITGGIHLAHGVMAPDESRINEASGVSAIWSESAQGFMLYPRQGVHPNHVGDPRLDREFTTRDPRIREAIELAIDKYALRDIEGGTGEAFRARLFRPLEEANPALFGPDACLYDPDRARELIGEAGYQPGEPYLFFDAREEWPFGDVGRTVVDMLEEVGFNVEARFQAESLWRSEVYHPAKNQELYLVDLGGHFNPFFGTYGFQSHIMENVEYTGQGSAPAGLDDLLKTAWTEVEDDTRRIQAYHEASQIIADERINIGLYQRSLLWGISDRIEWTPRGDVEIWGYDITLLD